MTEPMVITLQAPVACAKCGATLNPGERVRAYARQDGTYAIYCLGEHKASSSSSAPRGGRGKGKFPSPSSPSPASPSPASPSPSLPFRSGGQAQDLEALRKELVELRQAVEGITGALLSLVEVVNSHAIATGQWLDLVQKAIRDSK